VPHASFDDGFCPPCAAAFVLGSERLRPRLWFVLGFALPFSLLVAAAPAMARQPYYGGGYRAITTGIPLLDVSIVTAIVAVLVGKLAVHLRVGRYRRRFLAAAPTGATSAR
jgi:hypothetical protein